MKFMRNHAKSHHRDLVFFLQWIMQIVGHENSVACKTFLAKSCCNFSTTAEILTLLHLSWGWRASKHMRLFTALSSFSQAAKVKAPQKDFFYLIWVKWNFGRVKRCVPCKWMIAKNGLRSIPKKDGKCSCARTPHRAHWTTCNICRCENNAIFLNPSELAFDK